MILGGQFQLSDRDMPCNFLDLAGFPSHLTTCVNCPSFPSDHLISAGRGPARARMLPHRGERMNMEKDVLTTGEVAKICNVAPRTVSKWFDSGALKGYRIPGSKDRRIPMSQLIKFMKAHGIPLDGVMSGRTRVLVVDDEAEIGQVLTKVLSEQANYEVRFTTTSFAAGVECERFKPHVILLDAHLQDQDARPIAQMLRGQDEFQLTRVVAMSGKLTDQQLLALKGNGFDGCLKKPFQVRQVIEAIEACISPVS
jgi:excisionase family DNA binding protein